MSNWIIENSPMNPFSDIIFTNTDINNTLYDHLITKLKQIEYPSLARIDERFRNRNVIVRARIDNRHGHGSCCFLLLRQQHYRMQASVFIENTTREELIKAQK
jgi:hypothetical protein